MRSETRPLVNSIFSFFVGMLFVLSCHITARAQTDKLSYGLTASVNYPTIGTQNSSYTGEGNPTLGMFIMMRPELGFGLGHPSKNKTYTVISDEFARRLTLIVQPSFSMNSFRQADVDRRYNNYYLELSGLVYVQPFVYSDEFTLFTGIRPSLLAAYNTEVFEFGNYTTQLYDANRNSRGRFDFCVPVGISMTFTEAVSMELAYIHSFTNSNTASIIKGRASSIELSLKLNALGLANQFSKREDMLRKEITQLSKGSLLVMLPTPNPSEISELKKAGKHNEIQFVYQELQERNKKVMREFKSSFDFCQMYFYMDTSAYRIIAKNFDKVFVNSDLSIDPMIRPDSSNFFVASFCEDISKYTTKHQFGLFVYDNRINQLPKPFNVASNLVGYNLEGDPFNFVKKKRFNYSLVHFDKIIKRFNNRLLRYKDQ